MRTKPDLLHEECLEAAIFTATDIAVLMDIPLDEVLRRVERHYQISLNDKSEGYFAGLRNTRWTWLRSDKGELINARFVRVLSKAERIDDAGQRFWCWLAITTSETYRARCGTYDQIKKLTNA